MCFERAVVGCFTTTPVGMLSLLTTIINNVVAMFTIHPTRPIQKVPSATPAQETPPAPSPRGKPETKVVEDAENKHTEDDAVKKSNITKNDSDVQENGEGGESNGSDEEEESSIDDADSKNPQFLPPKNKIKDVIETPKSPAASKPKSPAASTPKSPAATKPKSPAASTPKSPAATKPKSPAAAQPRSIEINFNPKGSIKKSKSKDTIAEPQVVIEKTQKHKTKPNVAEVAPAPACKAKPKQLNKVPEARAKKSKSTEGPSDKGSSKIRPVPVIFTMEEATKKWTRPPSIIHPIHLVHVPEPLLQTNELLDDYSMKEDEDSATCRDLVSLSESQSMRDDNSKTCLDNLRPAKKRAVNFSLKNMIVHDVPKDQTAPLPQRRNRQVDDPLRRIIVLEAIYKIGGYVMDDEDTSSMKYIDPGTPLPSMEQEPTQGETETEPLLPGNIQNKNQQPTDEPKKIGEIKK